MAAVTVYWELYNSTGGKIQGLFDARQLAPIHLYPNGENDLGEYTVFAFVFDLLQGVSFIVQIGGILLVFAAAISNKKHYTGRRL